VLHILAPSIAQHRVQRLNDVILFCGPRGPLDVRAQVVQEPLAALLASPVHELECDVGPK
jgi:hypothetical protein